MKKTKSLYLAFIWILIASSLLAQDRRFLIIDPGQSWNSTGVLESSSVSVTAGQNIVIISRGISITNPTYDDNYWKVLAPSGPAGYSSGSSPYPLPGAPADGLICKIGESGDPFYVGQAAYINVAQSSGTLFFRSNDPDADLGDNQGYWVVLVIVESTVGINSGFGNNLPKSSKLGQNYPNPFNPNTTIQYTVNEQGTVTMLVYNVLGEFVTKLVNKYQKPGEYVINWDGSNYEGNRVSSGAYFYQLQIGNTFTNKKMIMLR